MFTNNCLENNCEQFISCKAFICVNISRLHVRGVLSKDAKVTYNLYIKTKTNQLNSYRISYTKPINNKLIMIVFQMKSALKMIHGKFVACKFDVGKNLFMHVMVNICRNDKFYF